MKLLDVNQLAGEVVLRDNFGLQATDPEHGRREFVQSKDYAAVTLDMVLEVAASIREPEEQSARVARAQDLANSFVEQLESAKARARRAETAQREFEAEVQELSAALARTRADLDVARRQLAHIRLRMI